LNEDLTCTYAHFHLSFVMYSLFHIVEGMPMVYWVSTESPATMISICLPPMLNIVRRFYAGYLSPFTSRLSTMVSSRSAGRSTLNGHGSMSNSGFQGSKADSNGNFQTISKGSIQNTWEMGRQALSTDSMDELVRWIGIAGDFGVAVIGDLSLSCSYHIMTSLWLMLPVPRELFTKFCAKL
jgi:hypothetical protein